MIPSPCTRVCTLDPATGFCLGCYRTMSEIERWIGLGDAERLAILARLPGRRAAREETAAKRVPRDAGS